MACSVDITVPTASSIHVVSLAKAWCDRGIKVTLVAPRPPSDELIPAAYRDPRLNVWLVPKLTRLHLPNSFGVLAQTHGIVRRIRRQGIGLVYLRSGILSFILVAALRLFTRARIVSEHNGWIPDEGRMLGHGRLLQAFEAVTQILDARLAHRVRVVTQGLADKLVARGVPAEKLRVIGNGTETESIVPLPRDAALKRFGLPADKQYIGFIGNLAPWQGVHLLVDAFGQLRSSRSSLRLLVAGDGIERPRLERRIAELGLAGDVIFMGWTEPALAGAIINCFDVAVAPFVHERNASIGLSPLKIRDYAAAGRPIVAAEVAGLSELAEAGCLVTHQPDSAEDLARKIGALLDDDARRIELCRRARRYAEDHFRWSDIACEILSRSY